MKKSMKILALVLALVMLCGCQNPAGTTPANTTAAPTGPADYTVTVADPMGTGVGNVGVKFMKNGEQVAMAITDENGRVTKNLERGEYTLILSFMDTEHTYRYNEADAKLTATQTDVTVLVGYEMGTDSQRLTVAGGAKLAYTLQFADSKVTITGEYDHTVDGAYAFTADENGLVLENTDVQIQTNLLKTWTFYLPGMNLPQNITDAEGNALATEKNESGTTIAPEGTYYVLSNEYMAYSVDAGCTYVKLDEKGNNYFIFTPTQAGIYEFTVVGEGSIGSNGTPNFASAADDTEITDNAFRKTIVQSMIGTNNTGTTQLVISVNTENAGSYTYLCITRVGDAPKVVEWEDYISTHVPTKYTLPTGATLVNMDVTQSYTLVYNEADQFYHLNTADGPVVLVRLLSPNDYSGFAFGNILFGSNIGAYHYDENGEVSDKVLYNDCMHKYIGQISGEGENRKFVNGMCDDVEGVYPLTKDLEAMFKDYGEYVGYWDSTNPNYLFHGMTNLNMESAWLFACCYMA